MKTLETFVYLRQTPLLKRKARRARLVKNPTRLRYLDHLEGRGGQRCQESLRVEGPRVTWHWLKSKQRSFRRKEPVKFERGSRQLLEGSRTGLLCADDTD
ncbi:MAG: hypothetical protein EXQ58_05670 [Acidobacteria bacterium]|nr:hypothetical protein [Acidobacteriota bacterium]